MTMLVATTGMEEEEAQTFIDDFTGEDFDINVRDDEENYIYEFDFIMPMFVGAGHVDNHFLYWTADRQVVKYR